MTRSSSNKTIVERKRTGLALKRLTVYLPPDLAKRVAKRAIDEERSQSELLTQAALEYLKRPTTK